MAETLDWVARWLEPIEEMPAQKFWDSWELRLREGRYARLQLPTIRRIEGRIESQIEAIDRRPTQQ